MIRSRNIPRTLRHTQNHTRWNARIQRNFSFTPQLKEVVHIDKNNYDESKIKNMSDDEIKDHFNSNILKVAESSLKDIGEETSDIASFKFPDLNTKFKVVGNVMKEVGKEIPNYHLPKLKTIDDVVQWYSENAERPEQSPDYPDNVTIVSHKLKKRQWRNKMRELGKL